MSTTITDAAPRSAESFDSVPVVRRAVDLDTASVIQRASLVAIGALPALVLTGVIDGWRSVIVALVGATVAAVTVAVAQSVVRRRHARGTHAPPRRGAVVAALALVVGGLVLTLVVVPALLAARSVTSRRNPLSAVVDGVIHGWSATITSPVPADATARLLVPVAVLAWAATAAATVLAPRRSSIASLLPGAVAFVLASVAAGRHPFAPSTTAVAFLVLSGVVLATHEGVARPAARRRDKPRASRHRRVGIGAHHASALGIVVIATAAAVIVGPRLTFGRADNPFDPRDHLISPTVPADAVNPLDLVASRRRQPDQPMFTVQADKPVRTRLVALETFDGARWTTTTPYERTGSVVPITARTNVGRSSVRAKVVVSGLTGPWLPSVGDPRRVVGVNALIDRASGSLVAVAGDAAGAAYTIDADITAPDPTIMATLPVAGDATAATKVPAGLPAPLREMADVATNGANSPLAKAALLERYLHLNFTRDDQLTSGQSYGHLVRALTENGAGTEEQFATAFAVLGRVVGLPTRVVVGFDGGLKTAERTFEVRSGDARVWPEVKFAGIGWLAFDPAPARAGSTGGTSGSGAGAGTAIAVQQGEDVPHTVGGDVGVKPALPPPTAATSKTAPANRIADALRIAAIVVSALSLVALLAATAVLVLKRRRTARRRRLGGSRERVLGAWQDVLDRLVEAGVNQPGRRTVEELVEHVEPMTTSLAGIYRPVNRALYDEREPGDGDATQAWRARDRFVTSMRRDATLRRRLRIALDPRPLVQSMPHREER